MKRLKFLKVAGLGPLGGQSFVVFGNGPCAGASIERVNKEWWNWSALGTARGDFKTRKECEDNFHEWYQNFCLKVLMEIASGLTD